MQGVARIPADGEHPVVGHQGDGAVTDVGGDLLGQLVAAGRLVGGDGHVAADVDHELLDDGGDGLAHQGEHGGVGGVAVQDAPDLVVAAVAGQVEGLLAGGAPLAVDDLAVEVDHHQVLDRHGLVGHRGRGHHDVAVGHPPRDVARRARHEAAGDHVLGGLQHGFVGG